MSIGQIFLLGAVVFFFFAAVDVTVIPRPTSWGLVTLALGILLAGVPIPSWKQ